ncbi:orotate phosphoribosyltransferase [Anaeromyxobacter sp. PSR-1]|nr:orotate phosphoribosyltransferase [Anaeromyxobacter sp. PSR-1]
MVDFGRPVTGRTRPESRREIIASATKRKTVRRRPPARGKAARAGAAAPRKAAPRKRAAPRARPKRRPEQPLGMGVADGFAMDRLAAPAQLRRAPKKAMREIGWAAFGEVARGLAARIHESFRPDVVVGIAKGGVFVGGALAAALGAEFQPVRIEKRRRDAGGPGAPAAELPALTGRRVLVVDDVAATGATLAKARAVARKAGAREVRTAVLVVRPSGARPDFHAFETDELILFAWDYQLDQLGAAVDPGEVGV